MNLSGQGDKVDVPDLGPVDAPQFEAACEECPIVDVMERRRREGRMAAFAGVLVAVLGVMSWTELGAGGGGIASIALGAYSYRIEPAFALAPIVAGALALGVLAMHLLDVL
jgi:hypothetical protein